MHSHIIACTVLKMMPWLHVDNWAIPIQVNLIQQYVTVTFPILTFKVGG